MKKIIYLFLPFMAFTACSTDSIDTEGNDSLDAKAAAVQVALEQSLDIPLDFCAGVEATFTFNFPQATNANGNKLQKTHIFLQILVEGDNPETEVIETEYYDDIINTQIDGAGPIPVNYTFWEAGTYYLQYKIGSGSPTAFSVFVAGCDQDCNSGYMIGDKNFNEIGPSNNWGWAHKFEFASSGGEETREIHHKNGGLDGFVTVAYAEDGTISVEAGEGVTITHLYISDVEPTATNAPGQFDKTQTWSDSDGTFWVILKAEVCK